MALLRVLARDAVGYGTQEVADSDTLLAGIIAPGAGNLTIGGTGVGGNVVVTSGQTLTVDGAAGSINLTGGADLLAAAGSTLSGFDSIEGITSSNLVDKSASETITGQWIYQAAGTTNPKLIVKAAAVGQSANDILFQVQTSAGANLFSVDLEGDIVVAGGETVSGTTNFTGNITLGDGGNTVQLGSAAAPAVGDNVYINTTGTADGNFSVTTTNFNIDTAGIIDTNGNVVVVNADAAVGTNEYAANVWLDGDGVANIEAWRVLDDGGTQAFDLAYKQNPTNPKNLAEAGWTSILTATPLGVTINGTLSATTISGAIATNGTTANVWAVNTDAAGATAENSMIVSAGGDGANVQAWRWFNSTTPKTFTMQYKQDPTSLVNPAEAYTLNALVAYSTGVVDFPYNVNAQAGLDVTGAALTVDANGIDSAGNIDLNNTLSFDGAGTIDTSATNNDLTINVGTGHVHATAALVDLRTSVTLLDIPAGSVSALTGLSIGGTKITTANFTAPNMDTLLNGSNADALHTHSAVDADQVRVAGMTTAGMTTYYAGYISANDTILPTDCSSATGTFATSSFAGVYDGTAGTMITNGKVEVQFIAGIVGMVAGDPAILSWTSAGRFTNSATGSPGGTFITRVGTVLNTSTYGVNQRCTIVIHAQAPSKK
jgi:hypothetical protein